MSQRFVTLRTRMLDLIFIGIVLALNIALFIVQFQSLIQEFVMDDVAYHGYWLLIKNHHPNEPPAFYMLGFTLLEVTSLKWWYFVKLFRFIIAVLGSYYIYQILRRFSVNQAISFFSSVLFTINYYHVVFVAEILKNVLAQFFALLLMWTLITDIYSQKKRILSFIFLTSILFCHLITILWTVGVLVLWFLLRLKESNVTNKIGFYILIGLSICFIIIVPYIRVINLDLNLSGTSSVLPNFFSAVVGRFLIGYLESGYGAPFIALSLASAPLIYIIRKTKYFGVYTKMFFIIAYFSSISFLMVPYLYISTLNNEIYFAVVRHTQINFLGYMIKIPNYIFIISLVSIVLVIHALSSYKQSLIGFTRTKVTFAIFLYFFSLALSVVIWRADWQPLIYIYSFLFFFAYILGYQILSKYNEVSNKALLLISLMIVLGILRASEYIGFAFEPHYWYRFEYESIIPFVLCSAVGMNLIFSNKRIDGVLLNSLLLKDFLHHLEKFVHYPKRSIIIQLLLMNFVIYINIGLTNTWLNMRFNQSSYYSAEVIVTTSDLLYFSTTDSIVLAIGPVSKIDALIGHKTIDRAYYLNETDSYSLNQFLVNENISYVIIDWNAEKYTNYYPPEFTKNYAKLNSPYFIKTIDCGQIETYAVVFA